MRRHWALVGLALIGVALPAAAHPLDIGYLRVHAVGPSVAVTLDVDVNAVGVLLHHDNADEAFVHDHASALAEATFAAAPITLVNGTCAWGPASAELTGRSVKVTSTATCRGDGQRSWAFPFVSEHRISSKFELLVKETVGSSERLTLINAAKSTIVLGSAATADSVKFVSFVGSGIAHIGAAPSEWRSPQGGWKLPDGIDHILFLLGLLLGGGTLLKMIGVATGFTVGHTITLALAALGVVHPPGWLIEPLIALSIAFVAVEALTQKLAKHRWKIALGFGLIHGFGFANALTQLHLGTRAMVNALFGYNLGVEIGQLAIVLVLAPLVLAAHRRRWAHLWVIYPAAIGIALCGLYWFVQRVSA